MNMETRIEPEDRDGQPRTTRMARMQWNFVTELPEPTCRGGARARRVRTQPHERNDCSIPVIREIRGFAAFLLLAIASSALADVHYVDVNSTNATPPYTNWATAATNIQDAINAAPEPEAQVIVTNGTYGPIAARSNPFNLSVRGINGALFTIIDGGRSNPCAFLESGVSLSGFTLTNGVGRYGYGGGAYGGTLNNCTLSGNSAATFGGGAHECTLNNCTLSGNSATGSATDFRSWGGGASSSILNNCTLTANSAAFAGGAYSCTLNNCTLTANSATGSGALSGVGGGAFDCALTNCIVYLNTATTGADYYACTLQYCWTADPLFVDATHGNLRLQSNSPCINAGNNAYAPAGPDLDGNPRISGGTVDIGAYEFQSPSSIISYAWLQQYGLPISSSTDTADQDGDGVDNYHEWLAGTDPTNALSSPARLTITHSGTSPGAIVLKWSTNAVGFTLQSTTNLVSPVVWSTNSPAPVVIGGQNTVTNPITGPQQFYRLVH